MWGAFIAANFHRGQGAPTRQMGAATLQGIGGYAAPQVFPDKTNSKYETNADSNATSRNKPEQREVRKKSSGNPASGCDEFGRWVMTNQGTGCQPAGFRTVQRLLAVFLFLTGIEGLAGLDFQVLHYWLIGRLVGAGVTTD